MSNPNPQNPGQQQGGQGKPGQQQGGGGHQKPGQQQQEPGKGGQQGGQGGRRFQRLVEARGFGGEGVAKFAPDGWA